MTQSTPGDETMVGHLPGWDMETKDDPRRNTHLWIVVESLQMVGTLAGPEGAAGKLLLQLTNEQQTPLHQGIWDADFNKPWSDYQWAYHFYNPNTGTNFWPCLVRPETCRQTARVWGAKCFVSSLDAYKNEDYATAVYQLGLSLHFLTDLSQPMHAANYVANEPNAPDYHQGFESYTIKWTNRVRPAPLKYEQTIDSAAFEGYIDVAARNALERSKVLVGSLAIEAWKARGVSERWSELYGDPVINASLIDARRVTSQYLLMWIQQALSLRPPHTWSLEDLTKSSGGQLATGHTLGAMGPGAQECVVSLDGDGHVQATTRQKDGSWQALDLTAKTGAPPVPVGARLTAAIAPGANNTTVGELVAFLDSDGHVHACVTPPGDGWTHQDLTQVTSAPPARGDLLWAYATTYVASQQILFVDGSGRVRSITRINAGDWSVLDLTTMTGAPPMDGAALSGSSWDHASLQAVVYLDAAGHVHEIGGWQQKSEPWTNPWHADLTSITKAPPAGKQLIAGSSWYAGSTKQVAYVGADSHIYELSIPYTNDLPWVCTDLTVAADSPPVDVVALAAFEWPADSEKHVAFLDRDGHIHDLSLGPAGGWLYLDVTQELNAPTATGTALAGYGLEVLRRLGLAYVDGYGHVRNCVAVPSTSTP
jgi:phospholipase C